MATTYQIKDVADRSGFSTAALRHYEEIGLLSPPDRTPSGYRTYDESVLERLAFISRAKQLGCTLQEISELVVAWSGGECGPIQDNLRTVVATKIEDTQRQIAESTALTADLTLAAHQLEQHQPDGPCDDHCGCISDPESVVCTLAESAADDRIAQWWSLLEHVVARAPVENGMRVTFGPAPPLDELMRLVSAEQECCRFFEFAITVDGRGVALEVRSPAEGAEILDVLFGAPS